MNDYVVIDMSPIDTSPKKVKFKKEVELNKEYTNCSRCNRIFLRGDIYTVSYYRCPKCRYCLWSDICRLFC